MRSPRVCLFGAAGDTGNLGVSALQESTTDGLLARLPNVHLSVFDHRNRPATKPVRVNGDDHPVDFVGAKNTRRIYRPESWAFIRAALKLKLPLSTSAAHLRAADAVLDFSGGDSFSDLYGLHRFATTVAPKQVALALNTPLFLMPQTYGPFDHADVRREAERLVRGARVAWARDPDSFGFLQELLGDDFDAGRHRQGVDVAFGLRPVPSGEGLDSLQGWLGPDRGEPIVGLNVNGMLYATPSADQQYGLRADYRQLVLDLVNRLLRDSDARILLIAHVPGLDGTGADVRASQDVVAVNAGDADRVAAVPPGLAAGELKWVISQVDWFCGARMHSCIAALSSGVPTAGVAYSVKTRGVFDTVGQSDQVVDARHLATEEAVEAIWDIWQRRERIRADLRHQLPDILRRANTQMDTIAAELMNLVGVESS